MKVLYLPLNYHLITQLGMYDALHEVGCSIEVFDYTKHYEENNKQSNTVCQQLIQKAISFAPDMLLMQIQDVGIIDGETVNRIKKEIPRCVIVNYTEDLKNYVPEAYKNVAKYSDINLICSTGQIDLFRKEIGQNVFFWQAGYNNKLYYPEITIRNEFDCDVIFIANNDLSENYPGKADMETAFRILRQNFGDKFHLYGEGWDSEFQSRGVLDQNALNSVYNKSFCCLNISNFNDLNHYFSNKLLTCMASGRPTVSLKFPKWESYFTDKCDLVIANSVEEIPNKVRWLMEDSDRADYIGKSGARKVFAEHTYLSRINDLFGLISDCEQWMVKGSRAKISKLGLASKVDTGAVKRKSVSITSSNHKKFVIVIPSYKNVNWCERNVASAINQNYDNYRVIYTDDNSPDGTFDKVKEFVENSNRKHLFNLIKNKERIGALANLHNMINSCDDDEIILTLDGDDWLAGPEVLNKLNETYSSGEVWMTYGQYQNSNDGEVGIAAQIPDHIINKNSFRSYQWCASHLRTFYTWLYKNIRLNDLLYDGSFLSMTWDMAIMFTMLELSGKRSKFISDVLYIYNLDNPINDHKVNVHLQQSLDKHIRSLPKYSPLKKAMCNVNSSRKNSVGLMIVATGKYHTFLQGLISSADNYFLKEHNCTVTYYVFSEKDRDVVSNRNIKFIHIEHRPFPYASMDRFKHFINNSSMFIEEDYLYYVDVDSMFVDYISGNDILGGLVGVRHCGFYNGGGPFEPNPNSVLYVKDTKVYKHYFGGGFSGGRKEKYLELSRQCAEWIDIDVSNGIIPLHHDETTMNKYFLDHEPDVILTPSYHYPASNIEYYKNRWKCNFNPKILLLDKNHKEMRS